MKEENLEYLINLGEKLSRHKQLQFQKKFYTSIPFFQHKSVQYISVKTVAKNEGSIINPFHLSISKIFNTTDTIVLYMGEYDQKYIHRALIKTTPTESQTLNITRFPTPSTGSTLIACGRIRNRTGLKCKDVDAEDLFVFDSNAAELYHYQYNEYTQQLDMIEKLAGHKSSACAGGSRETATFVRVYGLCYDDDKHVIYCADFDNSCILSVNLNELPTSQKYVTLFSGRVNEHGKIDGQRRDCKYHWPVSIRKYPSELASLFPERDGLYVLEFQNKQVRFINNEGKVSTLPIEHNFQSPCDIEFDINGDLIIMNSGANSIYLYKFETKELTHIAGLNSGNMEIAFSTLSHTQLTTSALFNYNSGVTVDRETGDIYVSDFSNKNVKRIICTTL